MKIYKVEVTYQVVVRAENQMSAERVAHDAIRHEDEEPDQYHATEITKLSELPPNWEADCRPWGERDPMDRTLGQLLMQIGEVERE